MSRFVAGAHGSTAIEYAMIAFLISIVAIAAFQSIGQNVEAMFQGIHFG